MIATVMMVCLRRLVHNRIELLLAFVVPIAFFSIFAVIFGGGVGAGGTPSIKVVAVDTVRNEPSRRVLAALRQTGGLHFIRDDAELDDTAQLPGATVLRDPASSAVKPLSESEATAMVRRGTAAMAIVIRADGERSVRAELLSDSSDQVAPQVVAALVQRALLTTLSATLPRPAGDVWAGSPTGVARADLNGQGPRLPPARLPQAIESTDDSVLPVTATLPVDIATAASSPVGVAPPLSASPPLATAGASAFDPVAAVVVTDVLGENKSNPVVTMYAAGIAVMFLLFGASGGGGALLEERENQTLDRLLTTGLTMDQLLIGKWGYLTLLGFTQTTLMFVWGQWAFGIDLYGHFDGFVMITTVTAGAAAAFGLLLATLCRTRGQLNGLSVVVVLTMSALGGSMVPRYVMSESLREAGLWTFNAWALDGYDKVFWRDLPVAELWPQMSVLMVSGAIFLVAARVLAIRWETE